MKSSIIQEGFKIKGDDALSKKLNYFLLLVFSYLFSSFLIIFDYNHILYQMQEQSNHELEGRHYAKIGYGERMNLVNLVQLEKLSISKAAKIKGIKLSTAKLIVSRYRKTGKVFTRKHQRSQIKKQVKSENSFQNDSSNVPNYINESNQQLCQPKSPSLTQAPSMPIPLLEQGLFFYYYVCPMTLSSLCSAFS